MTTKAECARKIAGFLSSEMTHDDLVKWADKILVEEDFPEVEGRVLLAVLSDIAASRNGSFVAHIQDYHALLHDLGFRMEPHLVAA